MTSTSKACAGRTPRGDSTFAPFSARMRSQSLSCAEVLTFLCGDDPSGWCRWHGPARPAKGNGFAGAVRRRSGRPFGQRPEPDTAFANRTGPEGAARRSPQFSGKEPLLRASVRCPVCLARPSERDDGMDARKVAAQFAAYTSYEEVRAGNGSSPPEATRSAREHWTAFLPIASEGLGKLLIRIASRPGVRPASERVDCSVSGISRRWASAHETPRGHPLLSSGHS
jgi:hypothetical protein